MELRQRSSMFPSSFKKNEYLFRQTKQQQRQQWNVKTKRTLLGLRRQAYYYYFE